MMRPSRRRIEVIRQLLPYMDVYQYDEAFKEENRGYKAVITIYGRISV